MFLWCSTVMLALAFKVVAFVSLKLFHYRPLGYNSNSFFQLVAEPVLRSSQKPSFYCAK